MLTSEIGHEYKHVLFHDRKRYSDQAQVCSCCTQLVHYILKQHQAQNN